MALIYLLAFFLVYKKALHTLGGLWVEKLGITCTPDRVLRRRLTNPLEAALFLELRNISLIGLALVAGLGGVGAYWLAGMALRPVRKVGDAARRISANTLDTRLAVGGPKDEVKEMADTFDAMHNIIYVPFSTAQQRLTGNHNVNSIDVMADSSAQVNNVQNATQQLLEQLHHISNPLQDDFTIQNQSQVLQTVQSASQTLTILLVSIASVSLLVSVTERTREIGIRIAIGTRPRDVMTQFLIEALMLSALGGLVGIILGTSGALMYSLFSKSLFVLNPLSVLLAFGFAAAVGIVFGFYPAQRAARMDPIVALRAE